MNKMCDLIDLESPDGKSLLNSRLASPLIPAPTDIKNNDHNNLIKDPIILITGKRDSLENNPFDMVLHKTTEYIQKRDDPFEVTLEKALEPKYKKKNELRTHSFDFTDDYIIKQNNKQKLKVNKTLDEYLMHEELTKKAAIVNNKSNESVTSNLTNINGFHENLETDNVTCTINVQDVDLSILNQSMMNDTLFEASNDLNKKEMVLGLYEKATIQVEKDKLNIGQTASPNFILKVPKVQRSHSQGENEPSKKSQPCRHISLAEPLRIKSVGGSNISSINSLDFLNEGFLTTHCSGSSVFSNLSNISCIPKTNSASSSTNLSIFSSNDTINRAFLKSGSSEKLENSKLSEHIDPNNKISPVTNELTKCTVPEVTLQFVQFEKKISEFPENIKEQNNEKYMDNKLIDVDLFTPEINSSKNDYRSFTSDASTDSVFLEGDKGNKSIFTEAKRLAKTFEELALKTSSGSSTDDLINSNPLWTSELLPAFDSEDIVDNLIELPSFPCTNGAELTNTKLKECTDNKISEEKDAGIGVNKMRENIKEFELGLIESMQTEKRITAASLLLELKKLIRTENNTKANKLVENLEKVLGINCENNTELLTTYFNATNNLAKSPQKSNNSSKAIQNIEKNNMEQSQEDNLTNASDNVKDPLNYKNVNFNDSDINKCTDNQKCLNGISNESLKTNIEKTEKEINEKVLNIEIVHNEDSLEGGNKSSLHEKVVVELLTNIAKLLTSQSEKQPTSEVLKNLGKILNSTSDDVSINKRSKNDGGKIPPKSVNRRSLDSDSKKQSSHKNVIRRSMSTSSTKDTISITSNNKSACQLKEVTKHFPSDPCLISPTSNKKVITKSNKDGLQKDTETGAFTTLELRKEKTATISTVKNKLKKKKTDVEVTNKKGPMRAVLPVGIMQKKETINNKTIPSYGTVTPPKSHKIISSTPYLTHDESAQKNTLRSTKPVASSTPDAQNFKSQKAQMQVTKKRNFSCDISPVPIRANVNGNNKINRSPKCKLPSPKRTTPTRRSVGSGIPKSQTPPPSKRLNSSFDINQYNRLYESPQRSSYKTSNSQKSSPVSVKKNGSMQQSPLRDSNKLMYKAKPVNLISKLQRHSVGSNMAEKENYI